MISSTLLTIAFTLAGCGQEFYSAHTVLHSDGRVNRSIVQPQSQIPEAARRPDLWEAIRTVGEQPPPHDWDGELDPLARHESAESNHYFAARGRFPSAEALPRHFVQPSADQTKTGTLEREVVRHDWGLVTEHVWRETLTDIVTLSDMRAARRELANLLINLQRGVLDELHGDEYDFSGLTNWMRTEGLAWFEELTDTYYELASRPGTDREQEGERRQRAIAARHGFQPENGESFDEFVLEQARKLVRRQDGQPIRPDEQLAEHVIKPLLAVLSARDVDADQVQTPLEPAMLKVIARDHGGVEQFSARVADLRERVFGLYGPFGTPRKFRYTHLMPGLIVATNGLLRSDNQVQWEFDAADAYPHGYVMTARSLEPNDALQQKLLSAKPLAGRDRLLRYVALVSEDHCLLAALRASAQSGTREPLHEYAARLRTDGPTESLNRVRAIGKLLGLNDLDGPK